MNQKELKLSKEGGYSTKFPGKKATAMELREGDTYQSNIDLESDNLDLTVIPQCKIVTGEEPCVFFLFRNYWFYCR